MMKKIITIVLTLIMSAAFIACTHASSDLNEGILVTQTEYGIEIKNISEADNNVSVIVAQYDNGTLNSVVVHRFFLTAGANDSVTLGENQKAFIWDSLSKTIISDFSDKTSYKIDYCGQEQNYIGTQDKYKAGEEVVLYYPFIATDTNYHFYLDDEEINPDYSEDKGYIISFTMPDHDVKLECVSKNSMVYVPEEEVMLVDYYRATLATVGGDGYDEMVLYYYSDTEARLSIYSKYYGDEEESRINYIVPYKAVEDCYSVIEKNKFREWNDKYPDIGLTGGITVCKFREADGSYVRVSTDAMPDNGKELLYEVSSVMQAYVKDEYKE